MVGKVIDFYVIPPFKEVLEFYSNPPPEYQNYVRVYRRQFERLKDITLLSQKEFIELLEESQIKKAVLHAEDVETTYGFKIPNEKLIEFVKEYPDLLLGFAGEDPHKGEKAVRDLERCYERGLVGLNLEPWEHKLYSNDRKIYSLYAKCEELGIPVWIHSSINFLTTTKMEYGRAIYIDEVAINFPDLKIILGHGGWPWVNEAVALAWRHPNVFIDISAVRPKYFATPGSGWEMLLTYGGSILQDKILFATSWPLQQFEESIKDVMNLPLKNEAKEKWLYKNAERLIGGE
jgi:hypothetical protein